MSHAWHEDDAFWAEAQEIMFDSNRLLTSESEVEAAERLLQLSPGAKVLDMCCGPGRHSLQLARRGYAVVGVDRTDSYLVQARDLTRAHLPLPEFVLADAREFVRESEFDAAISLYTSIGYFDRPEDDARLLENLFTSLKPGGRLLLQTASKEATAKRFEARTWFELGDLLVLQTNRIVGPFEKIETTWRLIREGRSKEIAFTVRLYAATELRDLLRRIGFSSVRVLGDYDGSPYDEHARRLVVLAQRPE